VRFPIRQLNDASLAMHDFNTCEHALEQQGPDGRICHNDCVVAGEAGPGLGVTDQIAADHDIVAARTEIDAHAL
jgi:hypothetical protein